MLEAGHIVLHRIYRDLYMDFAQRESNFISNFFYWCSNWERTNESERWSGRL